MPIYPSYDPQPAKDLQATLEEISDQLRNIADTLSNLKLDSEETITIYQNELSLRWVISSRLVHPLPTVFVTQIGDEIQEHPLVDPGDWNYINNTTIEVTFGNKPCAGYVILHKN